MKKLFLVFAKLLGLIQLYTALMGVTQMAILMTMISRDASPSLAGILSNISGLAIYLVVSLAIAWGLLAKTEWLAGKVGLSDEAPVEGLERVPALVVGIALIGIFVTVRSLPPLVRALFEFQQTWNSSQPLALRQLAPVALQLALGLVLALKPGAIAALVARSPAPPANP